MGSWDHSILPVVLISCLVLSTLGVQVEITPQTPSGLKFRIPDTGYNLVALHVNVNKPLPGVAAGDMNVDIAMPTGSAFEHVFPNIQVKPGDKINYWVYVLQEGAGKTILDQSYTIPAPTTTTISTPPTTTTTTTTTRTTRRTVPAGTTEGGSIVQSEGTSSDANKETTPKTAVGQTTLTGTGAGTGTGTCGCSGGAQKDAYNKEASCQSYPCLIFEDEFDKLDTKLWEHEITAGGGGNWEFQYYTNNRSNSYVRDGKLYLRPTLGTDQWGPQYPEHGKLNLWGSHPASECTGNEFWGCERQGAPGQVINPIQSARLRSSRSFNFKYGRMEVEAKMPKGDWLWPAIWLLPRWNAYGNWPASGEIDLVESRASSGTFADSFHKFTLDWDDSSIRFSVDGKEILKVAPPAGGFWEFGEFEKDGKSQWDNPWAAGDHMAPFDQEFFIIMNVAVGGVGFFPDNYMNSPYPKPWRDLTGHAATAFWNARGQWMPTWHLDQDNGEGAAMQVKYVKVWKMKP